MKEGKVEKMINVKETMEQKKNDTKTNVKEFEGLIKTPYCSAAEALNRRQALQELLKQINQIENDLKQVVRENSMTLPYEQNVKYNQFISGELKIMRHEVKRLIKAETEFELMGE